LHTTFGERNRIRPDDVAFVEHLSYLPKRLKRYQTDYASVRSEAIDSQRLPRVVQNKNSGFRTGDRPFVGQDARACCMTVMVVTVHVAGLARGKSVSIHPPLNSCGGQVGVYPWFESGQGQERSQRTEGGDEQTLG
jgi:hypothetical protein